MIAKCPNNPNHKKFVTVVHVTEYWIVDKAGNFLELVSTGETTHGPNPDNTWICDDCGVEAEVKER